MMWWHNGMGWGGWVVMTLTMVAFWSLVVFGILAIFRSDRDDRDSHGPAERDPLQILDERFARGEIDADEFHARRDALGAAHSSTAK
jgi:putative membrane protein